MSTKEWPMVPLGKVVQHRNEVIQIDDMAEYNRCRVQLHTKGIMLRDTIQGAAIKTKKQQVCQAGDFLVAEIDAKVGGFGIVPEELEGAIVSSHYFLFAVDEACLDKHFLGYFVKTPAFREQVNAQGSTNYAAIRPSHVLGYTISLPPLSEQRRIVAKIDQLAQRIDEARRWEEQAASETQLITNALFCGIMNRGAWKERTVGEIADGDCYGTSEKTHEEQIGVPVFRMGNIKNGSLVVKDMRYLQIAEKDRLKWILEREDILVNRTNSAELVGKCAVFDLDGEYSFASYIIRIRLDNSRAVPNFVARYINSSLGRKYIVSQIKQMTGQANVNAQKLKAMPIPLPSITEQRRIVAYLDDLQTKVDSLKEQQAKSSVELDALLPSILDRAFKGEL